MTDHSRSVALCQPAVRMVAIAVYAFVPDEVTDEPYGVTIYPIMAVFTHLVGNHYEHDLLIHAPDKYNENMLVELSKIDPFDVSLGPMDIGQVVLCPWPPSEDEVRLAPIIAKLVERALAGLKGEY